MLNQSLSASSNFLKGVAMIALVYVHYFRLEYGIIDNIFWIWDPLVHDKIATELGQYPWYTVILRYYAQFAVSMFFILSAWGLSYSLLAQNRMPGRWLDFMHARVRKLAPLYWIALTVLAAAALIEHHDSLLKMIKIGISFALKAAFLHTFHPQAMFNYNSALWFFGSLLFLYMLFPLLYRATLARPLSTLVASLVVGYLTTVLIKATPLNDWHLGLAMGGFPLARIGDFGVGIYLAVYSHNRAQAGLPDLLQRWALPLSLLCLALGLLGFRYEWLHPLHALGLALFAILAGTRLHDWIAGKALAGRAATAIGLVGVYSYTMFLFHMPLIRPWLAWVSDRQHVLFFGTLFLVVAYFVFLYLERFCNRYLVPYIQRGIDRVFGWFKPRTVTAAGRA